MKPRLSEAERDLRNRVRELAGKVVAPRAATVDAELRIPREVQAELVEAGLLAEIVGEGEVSGPVALVLVVEEISRASASVGAVLAARAGRVAMLLDRHGSDDQRRGVLRRVVDGGLVATAVGGGELDARPTVRSIEGQDVLDGAVDFVSGARGAEMLLVVANRDGEARADATEVYLVPAGREGVEVGEEAEKLGLNGAGVARVALDAVACGVEDRVGATGTAATLHSDLTDFGRLGAAAVAVGVAQAALDGAIAHVDEHPDAGESQAVQWMLADAATEIDAARMTLWYAATRQGEERGEAAAMARWLASEAATSSTRKAVQVAGQEGTLRSGSLERLYRDAKMLEVHDGSSEDQLREAARHLLPELVSES